MLLEAELLDLFGAKSFSKKLFFSVSKGRKQVSMLLDSRAEGEMLQRAIGGECAKKARSYPKGAWEWYYHGASMLDLCREVKPRLNYFQQKYLSEWLE